jgi:site-specific recombinase XerD
MEKILITEVINRTLSKLEERGISESYKVQFKRMYARFLEFSKEKNEKYFSVELADKFLLEKYNIDVGNLSINKSSKNYHTEIIIHRIITCLCDVALTNTISLKKKGLLASKKLNPDFQKVLDLFVNYRNRFNYSPRSTYTMSNRIKNFFLYLEEGEIYSINDITVEVLTNYLKTKASLAQKSISTEVSTLRRLLNIIYLEGITEKDLSLSLPKIKVSRKLKVPQVWNKKDLKKLFTSIDRTSPAGKRDYAILLMVAHYGLRSIDIKELKLTDLDWENNKINIIQSKTKKLISFPILHDVGWALADYLQNGRTKCNLPFLFITLNHPLRGFGQNSYALNSILQKRMREAKIYLPRKANHGMHALRHTLASVMLSQDVPLETISSVLGHSTSESTGIYLKTDMIRLKDCVLDPEVIIRSK